MNAESEFIKAVRAMNAERQIIKAACAMTSVSWTLSPEQVFRLYAEIQANIVLIKSLQEPK